MRNFKITVTAVVLLACVISLAACGAKNSGSSAAETQTQTAMEPSVEESTSAVESSVEETTAPAKTQMITGEVLDAAMNTVIIKDKDGRELIFGREDAETDFKDGLLIGNYITIEYTGEIDGSNTSGTSVIKITDAEEQ